jgi:GGDEF domain-containing protein
VTNTADDAIGNLMRIRADTRRWRAGWESVADRIRQWPADRLIALLMLDMDKSAVVRAEGIEAKVELVLACRQRVTALLPPDAIVIDSGTRDETCVVLPGVAPQDAIALAEQIRDAVSAEKFQLERLDAPVSSTLSCGIGLGTAKSLADAAAGAREGLARAKETRDAAVVGQAVWETWDVEIPDSLLDACRACGLDPAHPPYDELEDVVMQFTGIRHWLATRGLDDPESGLTRSGWKAQVEAAIGHRDPRFARLLDPVAQVASAPPGTAALRLRHETRYGRDRSKTAVTLSRSIAGALLGKALAASGGGADDLVVEALSLAADRAALESPSLDTIIADKARP